MRLWHFFFVATIFFPFYALPIWWLFGISYEDGKCAAVLGMVCLLLLTLLFRKLEIV